VTTGAKVCPSSVRDAVPMKESSILIVGAGPAGLAMARALQARAIDFDIVERSAAPPVGAGLFLPANAIRALDALGVTGIGHPIRRMRMLDHRGHRLVDLPFTTVWGDTGECRAVRRTELHAALAAGVPVQHGVADPRGYDMVIGADGIRSTVRIGAAPRPVGLIAWRFLATGLPEEHGWTVWQGRDRTFLAVALGGGHAYCYADCTGRPPDDWRTMVDGFADPVPALAAQGRNAHTAVIEEIGPVFSGDPRTVLIGDAAHAFSPNMAQGAALAFEDALVLAELIEAGRVNDFRRRRAARVKWVRDHTRQRDRARHLPVPVRDAVLRLAGRRMITSQFRLLRAPA
jgi:2-polyprenyl-6-methoxyphenol hydroxylase-like FAD-dependent oxidoreductase